MQDDTSQKKSIKSLTESQRIGETCNTVKAASSQRLSLAIAFVAGFTWANSS